MYFISASEKQAVYDIFVKMDKIVRKYLRNI